ncbi:MAG: hypothetical protein R3C99_19330 [Pirellulaceae bacterium]
MVRFRLKSWTLVDRPMTYFPVAEDSRDQPLDVLANDANTAAGGLSIVSVGPRDRGGSVKSRRWKVTALHA